MWRFLAHARLRPLIRRCLRTSCTTCAKKFGPDNQVDFATATYQAHALVDGARDVDRLGARLSIIQYSGVHPAGSLSHREIACRVPWTYSAALLVDPSHDTFRVRTCHRGRRAARRSARVLDHPLHGP